MSNGNDWVLTFNGLVCGPGTPFGVTDVTGWLDLQGVTSSDTAKPNADGTWTSPDWNPSRLVVVTLDVAGDHGPFSDAVAQLEAATQNQYDVTAVTLQVPGRLQETIYAKVRARTIPTDFQFAMGLTSATIQFFAPNPRRFAADVTAATPLPSASGGLSWPIVWPSTWAAAVLTGQVGIANPGNAAGPVKIRIDGPVTGPQITQVGTGCVLAFSDDLVVAHKDWIEIDMEARTVLDRGDGSRAAYITSRGWFGLNPGDNLIAWTAADYDSRALMTVTGTPAWK